MEGTHDLPENHAKIDDQHQEKTPLSSSSSSIRQPFASWVIFDSEATGLKLRPRITELCFLGVITDDLKSTGKPIPRVINKLQLCFNPERAITADASFITGLFNDVLDQMSSLPEQASLITGFLCSLPQPVCLIAHNGFRFDFPLLRSELCRARHTFPREKTPGIYCADSLHAFRFLDGLPLVSEWMTHRDNEEKRKKELFACSAPTQKSNGDDHENCVVTVSETAGAGSGNGHEKTAFSPIKRQLNLSKGDSPSACKLSKQETGSGETTGSTRQETAKQEIGSGEITASTRQESAKQERTEHEKIKNNKTQQETAQQETAEEQEHVPAFGFQTSVSDVDLVLAYEAAMDKQAEAQPVPDPEDGMTLQSQLETTPVRNVTRWSNTVPRPGAVVKKASPLASVNAQQHQRVARRLFAEDSNSVNPPIVPPGNNDNGSIQTNPAQLFETEKSTAEGARFPQGSLPDETLVQLTQQAESETVTSLSPQRCDAGDPMFTEGSGASLRTRTRDTQSSSAAEKGVRSLKTKLPLHNGSRQSGNTQHNHPAVIKVSPSTGKAATQPAPQARRTPSPVPPSTTPKKQPSYKLREVYRRQFGQYPEVSHTAEDDCLSLLRIIMAKRSRFLAFVEEHAVRLDSVDPMY